MSDNLRVGDRVVSVESSLGGKMWQVYNTDGLISAVTSRLPGQTVRIGFERISESSEEVANSDANVIVTNDITSIPRDVLSDAVDGFRLAKQNTMTSAEAQQTQAVRSGSRAGA